MKKVTVTVKRPSLFTCYRWFLENISDSELKARGCDVGTIETMHQIHEYILSGRKNRGVIKNGKITTSDISRMERMHRGDENQKTRVAAAYQNLLDGKSDTQLRDLGFSTMEIHKAREFHARYATRDMFPIVVAREMSITRAAAQRMQYVFRQRATA
jgi:hypothetical protein